MGAIKIPNNASCGIVSNSSGSAQAGGLAGIGAAVYLATSSYTHGYLGQLNNAAVSIGLHLYQGVRPTQAELDTWVDSSTIAALPRTSDLLVVLPIGPLQTFVNSALPVPLLAGYGLKTGSATWFALYAQSGNAQPSFITGDVSLAGGGGDLIVETTNVVLGQVYRSLPIYLPFPTKFSW